MNNFILECSPKTKTTKPLEADSLREVMRALKSHHLVAWCERQNTGAAKVGGRFIKFGWKGCTDILGQLKDGRLLAVECKRLKGGKLTNEQALFLAMVKQHGSVAFVARNLNDVLDALKGNDE